ncbi:HDOD domain-containing protein [Gammaproteobacteria bacterium AH-315-M22]|nr:HDOD domain-containing protein [Gammaproteobacteria bacterium AH-315-M22]
MGVDILQLDMPGVSPQGLEVMELVAADNPDIRKIEEKIMQDPALAGTVIRYANSPLYRRRKEITNVPNALTMLGLKNIRSAVVMATLHAISDGHSVVNNAVWQHGQLVAMLCKLIAIKIKPTVADDAEFVGLIHDLGILVLSSNLGDKYEALYQRALDEDRPLEVIEQEALGLSHDQVMLHLASQLRLPNKLKNILSSTHSYKNITQLDQEDYIHAIVTTAHLLLQQIGNDPLTKGEQFPETLDELKEKLKLDNSFIEKIVAKLEGAAS